jgi:DNA polymerase III sliding clamp (beta) subunit (PCNA family)
MKFSCYGPVLSRAMKILKTCTDKLAPGGLLSNVELCCEGNTLVARTVNSQYSAWMIIPTMGGVEGTVCVDCEMLSRVVALCNAEMTVSADGKVCTVIGNGKTKLPVVDDRLPPLKRVSGAEVSVNGSDFARCFNSVAHAIAKDETRIVLTGVLLEAVGGVLKMIALAGSR